ncbi:DUF3073 domain-containing protein [Allokutzneria sp. A3M-2-11 16]|uniref:DUF3073 domain-containing protein n=1 Tax=Allokutzneria sp. A3M-2-11 16 TaxID=2962043 RepID=UPI0020B8AAE2|nr:DUF3073 domain-containing protein [Allokutzneria sp. A3M-2-11 16]MCP3799162.1 DUF3073 domain-containing protein [Allokutzneria sp. A3M-2-11 16]
MGRGRAKAKQTKVARELKYHTPPADFDALQRELSGSGDEQPSPAKPVEDDEDDDPYEDRYADKYRD